MAELNPCPFCGGPAEHIHVYDGEEVIGCADRCAVRPCLARETYAWAADDWNRRSAPVPPAAVVPKVRVRVFELFNAVDSSQTVQDMAAALAKLGIEVIDA